MPWKGRCDPQVENQCSSLDQDTMYLLPPSLVKIWKDAVSNSHSWLPMPVARDSKSEQSGQIHESEAPTTDHSCLSINNSKPSLFFSPVHRKQFIPFEHNFKSLISNFFLNHLVDFFPIQSCLLSIISFFFKKDLGERKAHLCSFPVLASCLILAHATKPTLNILF